MRTSRKLTVALCGASALSVVALAPGSQASAKKISWKQRPVSDASSFTEPSIAVDKKGRIVICAPGGGGGAGNVYFWSHDGGRSFHRTDTVGTEQDGGGDCELQFLADGSIVSADLAVRTSVIFRSTDGGKTWKQTQDAGTEQDRQWFAHDPRRKETYLVYHGIAEEAEFVVTSKDGGKTWGTPELVNDPLQVAGTPGAIAKPGDTPNFLDQGYNTFSGPLLVDSARNHKYVVYSISDAQSNLTSVGGFGPSRGIVVAHKGPEDSAWTNRYAVVSASMGPLGGTVNSAIFPWGTVDSAGNVYVLFNSSAGGTFHTYYVWSKDQGTTWSAPIRVDGNPKAKGATVYVTGQAGAPGVLDVAWMSAPAASSPDDQTARWYVEFAQVRNAASARPSIERSRISNHVIHHGSICQKGILCVGNLGDDRSLGDFFELTIGPDGFAHVTWSDNGDVVKPKAGDRRVWWARQQGGRSAYAR